MSFKSIAAGFSSVVCVSVLLMPLLVRPYPVLAQLDAAPEGPGVAAAQPDEDCPPGAGSETSGNDGLQLSRFRPEWTCPRVPMRFAKQTGTLTRQSLWRAPRARA